MGQKNIFQTSRLESTSATGFIRGFYMKIFYRTAVTSSILKNKNSGDIYNEKSFRYFCNCFSRRSLFRKRGPAVFSAKSANLRKDDIGLPDSNLPRAER